MLDHFLPVSSDSGICFSGGISQIRRSNDSLNLNISIVRLKTEFPAAYLKFGGRIQDQVSSHSGICFSGDITR